MNVVFIAVEMHNCSRNVKIWWCWDYAESKNDESFPGTPELKWLLKLSPP